MLGGRHCRPRGVFTQARGKVMIQLTIEQFNELRKQAVAVWTSAKASGHQDTINAAGQLSNVLIDIENSKIG